MNDHKMSDSPMNTAYSAGESMKAQYDQKRVCDRSRQSLRDAILSRTARADSAANERDRLNRFIYLIDKNPDVFEMLELIRDLNLF